MQCSALDARLAARQVALDSHLLAMVLVSALATMVKAVSVEALLGVRKRVYGDALFRA